MTGYAVHIVCRADWWKCFHAEMISGNNYDVNYFHCSRAPWRSLEKCLSASFSSGRLWRFCGAAICLLSVSFSEIRYRKSCTRAGSMLREDTWKNILRRIWKFFRLWIQDTIAAQGFLTFCPSPSCRRVTICSPLSHLGHLFLMWRAFSLRKWI